MNPNQLLPHFEAFDLENATQHTASIPSTESSSSLLELTPYSNNKQKKITSRSEIIHEDMRTAPYQLALKKIAQLSQNMQIKRRLIAEQKNKTYQSISLSAEEIENILIQESFWKDIFPLNNNTHHHKFNKKIDDFFDLIYISFSSVIDTESLTNFLPNGIFRSYILQQYTDQNLQCLLNELTYFYAFLSNKKEKSEMIQNIFSFFPPTDSSDYECVPGMRIRLSSALIFAKKQLDDTLEQNTIEESIKDEVIDIYQSHHQEVIFKYKLHQNVRAGSEIHLMSFLDYLLGIDRSLIIEKDPFVFTPQPEIQAEDAFNIFQNFHQKLESSDEKLKLLILNTTEDFFDLFKSTQLNETNLSDIKNHTIVKLISQFNQEFDISSEHYLSEDAHDYTQYEWNLEKITNELIKTLKGNFLEEKETLAEHFKYISIFDYDITEKIIKNLYSNHVGEVMKSLTLLFIAGENFIHSSPILFLRWMNYLEQFNIPNYSHSKNIPFKLSLIEKKWGDHPYYQAIKSRTASILQSFTYYTTSTTNKAYDFNEYTYFLKNKNAENKINLLQELIKGNAPLYEIKSMIDEQSLECYLGFLTNPTHLSKHAQAIEIITSYLHLFPSEKLQQICIAAYKNKKTDLINNIISLPANKKVFFEKNNLLNDERFISLFQFFVEKNEVDFIKKILDKKHHRSSYFFSVSHGKNIIDLLIQYNYIDLFKLLIEHKIIDMKSLLKKDAHGKNFVHHIAEHKDCDFLAILIDHQQFSIQKLLAQDKETNTPIHIAAINNNVRFVRTIIQKTHRFFSEIYTANRFRHNLLHIAIINHAMDVFSLLSQSKLIVDLNRPDVCRNTPLHLAVMAQEPHMVRTLLSRGGAFRDLFAPNNLHLNVFHLVAQVTQPEILDILITENYGCGFLNYSEDASHTPAHAAATSNNLYYIERLIQLKIPKEQLVNNQFITNMGLIFLMSPLDIARQKGHYDIEQAIINYIQNHYNDREIASKLTP